jgi:hypothetical protein
MPIFQRKQTHSFSKAQHGKFNEQRKVRELYYNLLFLIASIAIVSAFILEGLQ